MDTEGGLRTTVKPAKTGWEKMHRRVENTTEISNQHQVWPCLATCSVNLTVLL